MSWCEMSHKQVCGATTGDWLICSNCTITKNLFWTSDVKYDLGHSLTDVESGTVAPGQASVCFKEISCLPR